jgi:hypothetical protein
VDVTKHDARSKPLKVNGIGMLRMAYAMGKEAPPFSDGPRYCQTVVKLRPTYRPEPALLHAEYALRAKHAQHHLRVAIRLKVARNPALNMRAVVPKYVVILGIWSAFLNGIQQRVARRYVSIVALRELMRVAALVRGKRAAGIEMVAEPDDLIRHYLGDVVQERSLSIWVDMVSVRIWNADPHDVLRRLALANLDWFWRTRLPQALDFGSQASD